MIETQTDCDRLVTVLESESDSPELWQRLRANAAVPGALHSFAWIVLTPDLSYQRLFQPFWSAFVDGLSVEVVAAVQQQLSPYDVQRLYSGRVTHRDPSRRRYRWLTARLFELGPVLGLALRSAVPRDKPLQSVYRDVKGKSDHGEHSAHSIRGLSPISDRAFSLVHTPDDYGGVLHEWEMFLGTAAVARLLYSGRAALTRDEVSAVVSEGEKIDDVHPLAQVTRLIRRAVAVLLCDPRTPLPMAATRAVLASVANVADSVAQERSFDRGWEDLIALAAPLETLDTRLRDWSSNARTWSEAAIASSRHALLSLLIALCGRRQMTNTLIDELIEVHHRNNLPLSAWEQHRLHILAAFHGISTRQ